MYKLAIIGCGRISYKHVQAAIDNAQMIKLVACCDVIKGCAEKRAKEYAQAMGSVDVNAEIVVVYTDYKEMLDAENIDLVAICTESGYHAEISIYCMKKEKHVIVEKPMALSTEDADRMILASKQNNVKLCISHQNRFNPPIQKLRRAVEEGRFGKIIAGNARVLWNRDQNYYKQALWRGTYELDGGCLMNQCIHNIDLLQWMMGGDIDWVHGEVMNNTHPYIEAEDYGSIQIKFRNGAIGNVEGTVCLYPQNLEETITIIGEKGTAVIGGLAVNKVETWRFSDEDDCEESIMAECNTEVDNVYGNGHTPLYKDMIKSIREDKRPYIDGESGKKAMEIILATYKSSLEGKRIGFPLEKIESKQFGR